jgi:hypothetical protein
MYRVLPDGQRLGFGDVISSSWLYDLYLRHDAIALKWEEGPGGKRFLKNAAPDAQRAAGKDHVLSHADSDEALGSGDPRRAIILTDDCEMQTFAERRTGSGRVLFAAIRTASQTEIEQAQTADNYRRFALPTDAASAFAGGIVEFQRIFSVSLPSLTQTPPVHTRLVGLTPGAQVELAQRLCAHVTRHGPLVALKETEKLAMMLTAQGDPAAVEAFKDRKRTPEPAHTEIALALTEALTEAWSLEHGPLNFVADAWERGDPPAASVAEVRAQLQLARDAFDKALQVLDTGTTSA